tara:strand:+ start:136702 stop:136929 length:228 start_codon:yes stop_codon:yes gene_type:complete
MKRILRIILYIVLATVLFYLMTSCGIAKDFEDPDKECRCDYTEMTVDGVVWVMHPKLECPPHNQRPENYDWILIH